MSTEKTTPGQLFAALFVSRLLVSFTYISVYGRKTDGGAAALSALFSLLLAFGVLFLQRSFLADGEESILVRAERVSPALCRISAAAYLAVFLFAAFAAAMRIEVFTGTVLFSDNRNHWLTALMLAGASYGAYKGLRAVGRAAAVTTVLTGAGLLLLVCAAAGKIRTDHLVSPFRDGLSPLLQQSALSLGCTAELAVLPILRFRCAGSVKKAAPIWLIASFGCAAALAFLDRAVLGGFGETEIFPVYALTTHARLGEGVRLDALFTAIWILCALIKLCLYLTVLLQVLRDGFRIKNKAAALAVICALCAGAVIALSYDLNTAAVFTSAAPPALFAVSALLIPLTVRTAERVREKRTVIGKGRI